MRLRIRPKLYQGRFWFLVERSSWCLFWGTDWWFVNLAATREGAEQIVRGVLRYGVDYDPSVTEFNESGQPIWEPYDEQ